MEAMINMVLECKETKDFKPHPEGIHPAVCVDCIDLGMMRTEYQGQERMVHKLKLVFESMELLEDGTRCTVSKSFTASLHSKARLAEFLGRWRGRPVVTGESIDLGKLIGESCTLVISHQQNVAGRTYASIDAVSKPTRKLTPSGHYDPAVARQRMEEWKARDAAAAPRQTSPAPAQPAPAYKSPAPAAAPAVAATPTTTEEEDNVSFDPEVGF